ncbi:MAG: hypothetical protein IKW85_07685 [Muribaculaceae bacterium]|nr:hypothetical protein [Muribaculaceae bacterium]
MKKLLVILCVMYTVITYAQSISVDRIETNGKHQIMTSTKDYKIGGIKYSFGLKIYEDRYDTDWLLLVSSFNTIPDNTIILMKLNNGDIIELPVNNVHTGDVTLPGYVYNIGKIGYVSPSSSATYYSSVYVISPADLTRIETYGIEKIRIGNSIQFVDKKWSNNSLGKYLTKCRKKILERLEKSQNKNKESRSFYDDF